MGILLSLCIKNEYLNANLSDILRKYDKNEPGFTKKEMAFAINDVATTLGKWAIDKTKYDEKVFDEINTNNDKIASYEEIADYIKKEFGLNFDDLLNKKLKNICEDISKAEKKKKKEKKGLNVKA